VVALSRGGLCGEWTEHDGKLCRRCRFVVAVTVHVGATVLDGVATALAPSSCFCRDGLNEQSQRTVEAVEPAEIR